MANRTRRFIQKSLTWSDLHDIRDALVRAGRSVRIEGEQLHSSDTALYVTLGEAVYENDALYRRAHITGAHFVEVGDDPVLDTEIDKVFLKLVEAGGYARCSHCNAHTIRPENLLFPVPASRSCDRSLQLRDPDLFNFLQNADRDELMAAVSTDYLKLQIT